MNQVEITKLIEEDVKNLLAKCELIRKEEPCTSVVYTAFEDFEGSLSDILSDLRGIATRDDEENDESPSYYGEMMAQHCTYGR